VHTECTFTPICIQCTSYVHLFQSVYSAHIMYIFHQFSSCLPSRAHPYVCYSLLYLVFLRSQHKEEMKNREYWRCFPRNYEGRRLNSCFCFLLTLTVITQTPWAVFHNSPLLPAAVKRIQLYPQCNNTNCSYFTRYSTILPVMCTPTYQ
jgi:hypothetical protein